MQKNSRLADWIRQQARNVPNRRCFVTEQGATTFAEVNARVNRVAGGLARFGVRTGDRVALFATDSPEYIETLLACAKLGAVFVPLNPRLALPELQTLLRTAEAKVLFYSERYADLVHALDVPGLTAIVDYGAGYAELLAHDNDDEADVEVSDDDTVCLAFTSGTTATPKAVVHSQRFAKHLSIHSILSLRLPGTAFHYSAAPQFHIAGMHLVLGGIALGYPSLILAAFDPATAARWMSTGGLDRVFLVPTMIDSLLQHGAGDFSRIRHIVYGGSPMSPALLRRAMDTFGCDFTNAFGAGTEAGTQTVLTPEDHRLALAGQEHLLGSIGKPAPGVDLKLCDDEWNEVPDGDIGEIVTRSDAVMDGYLGQPEATNDVLRDGWFRSGDLAYRDRDGYLYLSGRTKDMIIRGGENIYPIEIETVLAAHPSVREAAVVGVADEHWGEIVRAHVVLEPGAAFDERSVQDFCRQRLATFKVPTLFATHSELPRNAAGKVLKRELRSR
ncbi:class I adenylate-forming enzyme family protein [Cryptosporangium sp. NPDC048952]|uniref:class I adenylate-forming enzyme family protein n=1 Tax=Cryptosporangium sp. NPDC048952 TaxID=3363961 RepID=UPI00372050E0